ncbi:MAG: hypothetical protein ACT4O0_18960 [Pseudonocardia sp.]
MTTTDGPEPTPVAQAITMVDQVLRAAKAQQRRDLLERLRCARASLEAVSRRDELSVGAAGTVDEAVELMVRALATLECDLRHRRAMLEDPVRSARLAAELADARARAGRFAAVAKEWQHVVGDGFAGLNSDTEFGVRIRLRELQADGERAIADGDPGRSAGSDATVRARLVEEADLAYRRLYDGVHGVAGRVAGLLELPSPHLVSALLVTSPVELVAQLPPPPAPRGRPPLPARVLKVFRPGWSGILMILIATRLLGVQVPGWALAAGAVIGAAVLGGAAYTGERGRALERRRADATAALRRTVEEFQLVLIKQLRDASRAAQRDLRRSTAAVVGARSSALTEELDVARVAADADRRATTELAAIAGDLRTFEQLRRRATGLRRRIRGSVAPTPGEDGAGLRMLHVVA